MHNLFIVQFISYFPMGNLLFNDNLFILQFLEWCDFEGSAESVRKDSESQGVSISQHRGLALVPSARPVTRRGATEVKQNEADLLLTLFDEANGKEFSKVSI